MQASFGLTSFRVSFILTLICRLKDLLNCSSYAEKADAADSENELKRGHAVVGHPAGDASPAGAFSHHLGKEHLL
jgi:hypothetical protein